MGILSSDISLSRRAFLKNGALSLLSLYDLDRLLATERFGYTDLFEKIPSWPNVGLQRKVVVLGGGLSGLCAATSLREAGFSPIVLEKTARTGGRVFTLRNYFEDGQYAELGATRIADTHALTLAYAKKYKLPLIEFPYDGANHLYDLGGKRFTSLSSKQGYPENFELTIEEKKRGAEALRCYLTQKGWEKIGDSRKPEWPTEKVKKVWDKLSFHEAHTRLMNASPNGAMISRLYNGSEVEAFSALYWLAAERIDAKWDRTYAIEGGNDLLPRAFESSLANEVITQADVKAVKRIASGRYVVNYQQKGADHSLESDFVVCALPLKFISQIKFEPGLSEKKYSSSREIEMQSVSRINLQFNRRFWNEDHKLKGLLVSCSDTPIERFWDLSSVQAGKKGLLTSYVQYENSKALARFKTSGEVIDFGLQHAENIFPGARGEFTKGFLWEWHKQPWTQGAWALYKPNQIHHLRSLQKREGNIFFTGDHTTVYSGWIQGAFESAHNAVAEIIQEAKKSKVTAKMRAVSSK